MAVIRYKPTSPARRNMSVSDFAEITSTTPERSLLVSKNKTGGRNNTGRITVRHIGGGNRNKYRIIDFKRNKDGIPAKVASVQYDPNRSANIREALYTRSRRSRSGRHRYKRRRRRHQSGQRASSERHPRRYHRTQHRTATRQRRSDRPFRRRIRSAHGERGRQSHSSYAFRRDEIRKHQMQSHHRTGRQPRA